MIRSTDDILADLMKELEASPSLAIKDGNELCAILWEALNTLELEASKCIGCGDFSGGLCNWCS